MNNVKQYTFTLFCCCLAVVLINFISTDSCRKQISYVSGMIILITVLSPLTYLIYGIQKVELQPIETVPIACDQNDILAEQFKFNLSEIIEDKLKSKGIFTDDIRIEIVMSEDKLHLGKIEVALNPSDSKSADDIKNLLERYLDVEITVTTSGGEISG